MMVVDVHNSLLKTITYVHKDDRISGILIITAYIAG